MVLFGFLLLLTLVLGKNLPNIITIITDDQGNSDASFNYAITSPNKIPPISTPNLDYLANNGIIFKRMYVQNSCSPTRVAFLTTRYPHSLGNSFPGRSPQGDLKPNVPTFLHQLKKLGYKNHLIGKYGLDHEGRIFNEKLQQWQPNKHRELGKGPLGRGFDTFYGLLGNGHNHYTKKVLGKIPDWHRYNETHILHAPNDLDTLEDVISTDAFTMETIDILNSYKNKNNPFFIELSFTMVHDPLQVDPKYMNYDDCKGKSNIRRQKYCGMVKHVDNSVGQIIETLKNNKLLDNTIIVFFSDNGGFPGVGGFNYPFKGTKASNYEGGIRVPSFMYLPNIYKNSVGTVYKPLIHVIDVGITLLNIITSLDNNNIKINNDIKSFYDWSDGIDFTSSFKKLPNVDIGEGPRNNLIVESNGWKNTTVYIKNMAGKKSYKLFLGYSGSQRVYKEPDTSWALNSKDIQTRHKIANVINDFLTYLSPDYFVFEMGVGFFVGSNA